jgi:hypothetical protein
LARLRHWERISRELEQNDKQLHTDLIIKGILLRKFGNGEMAYPREIELDHVNHTQAVDTLGYSRWMLHDKSSHLQFSVSQDSEGKKPILINLGDQTPSIGDFGILNVFNVQPDQHSFCITGNYLLRNYYKEEERLGQLLEHYHEPSSPYPTLGIDQHRLLASGSYVDMQDRPRVVDRHVLALLKIKRRVYYYRGDSRELVEHDTGVKKDRGELHRPHYIIHGQLNTPVFITTDYSYLRGFTGLVKLDDETGVGLLDHQGDLYIHRPETLHQETRQWLNIVYRTEHPANHSYYSLRGRRLLEVLHCPKKEAVWFVFAAGGRVEMVEVEPGKRASARYGCQGRYKKGVVFDRRLYVLLCDGRVLRRDLLYHKGKEGMEVGGDGFEVVVEAGVQDITENLRAVLAIVEKDGVRAIKQLAPGDLQPGVSKLMRSVFPTASSVFLNSYLKTNPIVLNVQPAWFANMEDFPLFDNQLSSIASYPFSVYYNSCTDSLVFSNPLEAHFEDVLVTFFRPPTSPLNLLKTLRDYRDSTEWLSEYAENGVFVASQFEFAWQPDIGEETPDIFYAIRTKGRVKREIRTLTSWLSKVRKVLRTPEKYVISICPYFLDMSTEEFGRFKAETEEVWKEEYELVKKYYASVMPNLGRCISKLLEDSQAHLPTFFGRKSSWLEQSLNMSQLVPRSRVRSVYMDLIEAARLMNLGYIELTHWACSWARQGHATDRWLIPREKDSGLYFPLICSARAYRTVSPSMQTSPVLSVDSKLPVRENNRCPLLTQLIDSLHVSFDGKIYQRILLQKYELLSVGDSKY